jgi:hypothetical protein
MLGPLPRSLVDLGGLVQALVAVCRSPAAMCEPEVGRATLAVSAVTSAFERATQARADAALVEAHLQEAMRRAQEALERARAATLRQRDARERAAPIVARAIARGVSVGTAEPAPLLRAWTVARAVRVRCPACGASLLISYRYRFMEGLRAREVPCPLPGCGGAVLFHFPVGSFDHGAQAAAGPAPAPRLTSAAAAN